MSNWIHMERKEIKTVKTGKISREVSIIANDCFDCVSIDQFGMEEFPDSDLDLLEALVQCSAESGWPAEVSLFDYMVSEKKCISIDDTFYDYPEIAYIFEKHWINR